MILIKTEDQIKRIHESCQLLAQLHEELAGFVESGMSTREVDSFAYDYIIRHKGTPAFLNYMGFPATCCISINEEVIHGIPGERIIKDGDIVSLDIGINLNGYISDAARTLMIGNVSERTRKLVEVTEQSFFKGLERIKNGKGRIHDISKGVYTHAVNNGFTVVRDYCGHGVGLEVHEEPQIPNYVSSFSANPRIREGMVLAIEPMVNQGSEDVKVLSDGWTVVTRDGQPSSHYENTIAVTAHGIEILTQL